MHGLLQAALFSNSFSVFQKARIIASLKDDNYCFSVEKTTGFRSANEPNGYILLIAIEVTLLLLGSLRCYHVFTRYSIS